MRDKIKRHSPVILVGKDPSSHLDEFIKVASMTCPHRWLYSFKLLSIPGRNNAAKKLLREIRGEVPSLQRLALRVVRTNVRLPFLENAPLLQLGTLKDVVLGKRDK